MAFHLSTRRWLLELSSDLELVAKELIENLLAPKQQKMSPADHAALMDLLVHKDQEFRAVLELAGEQAGIQDKINDLRAKVDVYNGEILELQKKLKEAETKLIDALHQMRQKMDNINQAKRKKVSSEEIIKYAHRISSANAVSAPLSWSVGDVRRPYPTDIEMRNGFLGKSDLNINGSGATQSSLPAQRGGGSSNPEVSSAFPNQFGWNNLGELHMSMAAGSVPLETRAHTTQDDVEVMSTDSSSSSSSDSQ